ncbi:MAG TPA: hypothetical protein VGO87_13975 [Acidimicrobiia bacterium]|jgi:hypothetical protein
MSTARLTWVVLDRLVPSDDEAAARAALIARDPELAIGVATGAVSEDEAIETLRRRQGGYRPAGDAAAVRMLAVLVAVLLVLAVLAAALVH